VSIKRISVMMSMKKQLRPFLNRDIWLDLSRILCHCEWNCFVQPGHFFTLSQQFWHSSHLFEQSTMEWSMLEFLVLQPWRQWISWNECLRFAEFTEKKLSFVLKIMKILNYTKN
jgi:hypothetical protein